MPQKQKGKLSPRGAVTQPDQSTQNYVGLSSEDFKTRLAIHEHSFRNPEDNQTALIKHILDLKDKDINYEIKWKLIDRAKPYSPEKKLIAIVYTNTIYYWIKLNPLGVDKPILLIVR